MSVTGLPPLQLAASGGHASNDATISNAGGTYNAAFNVGSGAGGGVPSWLILVAIGLAVFVWRR